MRTRRAILVAATHAIMLGLCGMQAAALDHSPRQYYGAWQKPPQRNYFYRNLYYKPTPTFSGYKHHHVIFFPTRPNHFYFYNPYQKQFWGRCPTNHGGEPRYSLLAPADRKPTMAEIAETAFPPPGALPAIPESSDGLPLDLPPDDLPTDAITAE